MEAQTGTKPVSESHAFDTAALQAYLEQRLDGFAGPLSAEQFKGGQSNPTYKLVTPQRAYVMRSKPGPAAKLLASAHAVEREFTVMQALYGSGVPVARMLALCNDESVIGRVFFIMEHVEGRVLWDPALPGMSPAERSAHYREMNRVIATLHRVPFAERGLAGYGKSGNYLERQIGRWGKQYQASITQPIPEMDALLQWLPAHIPASGRDDKACIVHGDYRLDNMIFHPSEPRVLAVLDWELSTLGHPLADFSYHCMVWHVEPSTQRGLEGLDLPALGIPTLDDYMAMYCEQSGLATPEVLRQDWSFYMAYNLFRLAAIAQGIAKRVEAGTASSAQAKAAGASAAPRARRAWQWAQQAQQAQQA